MRLDRREFLKALGMVGGGLFAWTRGLHYAEAILLPAGRPGQQSASHHLSEGTQSGIAGTITDIVTGLPIAGAAISVANFGSASSDAAGHYVLPLPPGIYEIQVQTAGFMETSRVYQQVPTSSLLAANFALIPLNPTEQENSIIYDRLIGSPSSASQEPPSNPGSLGIAPAIVVPSTIKVLMPDGTTVTMAMDDYVKGVVPAEMPPSWPAEALKAQAVVARSYAAIYALAGQAICTTSSCQNWTPNKYTSTNNAVDATSGQVVTYNGAIVSTHYYGSCGGHGTRNSEDAILWKTWDSTDTFCALAGWGYVAYERAKSCWGPHYVPAYPPAVCEYYGHGVGMCQYGASDRASEGWNYLQILTYYYTNIVVFGAAAPPPPPTPVNPTNGQFILTGTSVTLSWTAVGNGYYAQAQRVDGTWSSQFGSPQSPQSSTTWGLGVLAPGMYQWRVGAINSYGDSGFSQYCYFIIADKVYKTYFPRADKYGTGG